MKRSLVVLLSLGLGVGAFGLVLYFSDSNVDDVWQGVATAGWAALGAMIGLAVLQLLAQSWSWRFLALSHGKRAPFPKLLEATLVGWGMNFLTPSMYLGGEPVRALYLAHASAISRREALATVIVSKYLEFSTFLVFLLASTAVLVVVHACDLSPWVLGTVIAADVLLTVAGGALMLSVFRRWGLIVRLTDAIARIGIGRKWLEANRPKILDLEAHVHRAFAEHRRETLKSFGAMFLFTIAIYLRPVPFFLFAREAWPFTLAELAVFFCLSQLLQALQFTPGGLGLHEGGFPGILLLVGVPPAEALAFVAFQRIADLVLVGVGFSLFTHTGLRRLESNGRVP